MNPKYSYSVSDRFMKYVTIDTQSDPNSTTFPSSAKQFDLAKILLKELLDMGYEDAEMDEHGYVMATIKASQGVENSYTVCFCAHMDTAPDCSGTDVKPILHKNYQGQDIVLPDDKTQIITTTKHTYLKEKIGDDIITASGTTLLGADDKAGVAIIMDVAKFYKEHPEVPHCNIRILFTPDEEVGRGVEKLDMKKLNADFGYTMDGGELGAYECDTFSADGISVVFHGISAHPGYAKGKMVNAIKVASHFVDLLPKNEWSPETTEGEEGFVHPVAIEGKLEQASVHFISRNFDTKELDVYKNKLNLIAKQAVSDYEGASYELTVKEQYRNMREVLDLNPHVIEFGRKAIQNLGIKIQEHKVRGGTDGSRLSFMGLPCPNIFTGEMAIHGKHEFVSVQDMQRGVDVCIEIARLVSQSSK